MFTRRMSVVATLLISLCAFASVCAFADSKSNTGQQPITHEGRMMLMRSLNAEFVYARQALPQGTKPIVVKNGQIVSPTELEMKTMLATYGPAVKPGDRAQITDIDIKDNKIIFEINGGPKKKTKWYQHIQVSGMGGTAQAPDDAAKNARGAMVQLAFDKFVPELTGDQVRQMLSPIFNFKAMSAAEAYIDSVPPQVKEAIKNHQVLVGMNREMVNYAKGKPNQKIREHDEHGRDYEEWLYGEPPQEVQFVRFVGDEVVRLEIMKVDGEKVVRTEKEVDAQPKVAEKKEEKPAPRPANAPTLRRPGEPADDQQLPSGGKPTPSPNDAPWGTPPPVPNPVPTQTPPSSTNPTGVPGASPTGPGI